VKIHCSVLAEDAIRAAISDWKKKNNVAETEAASATLAAK
jgi:nitrogen fixation NifU-like protein